MKTFDAARPGAASLAALALSVVLTASGAAAEAKLVRYPSYSGGRIAFTYLGDVWTADETGQNIRRITVHRARDVYPRFSPDGKWIAFSSDRSGNLDVFVVPAAGGVPRQLTFHSAEDTVLSWTPDGKGVLFASNRAEDFAGKLYTVGLDGGMPRNAGPDMGVSATYSPDGSKLALNRHGQVYWRKYYRGANQTEVTVMDVAARKFSDLTDFKGSDSWPMWGRDGAIYFVSDREGGGLTNIWRVPEKGGAAEPVTSFKQGDVRWPSISADGKVIVFEHDFGVWKLDLASRKSAPIALDIAAETQENTSEVRSFSSEVDDYSLEPSGRRIVFSIYGEVFTAPVEEGDLTQVTDGPSRDRDAVYSPDGKRVAYVSDRSGREEIYLASPDGSGQAEKITDLDALKLSVAWSRDSKALAFVSSDGTLRKYEIESRRTTPLVTSKFGNIGNPVWSPDGQWIAYARPNQVRTNDIYLLPAAGGEERLATFDSYNDSAPRFAPNGRKLYFVRTDGFGGGDGTRSAQIYAITLEREEKDPDDPQERTERGDSSTDAAGEGRSEEGRGGRAASADTPVKPVAIDWAGLKRRTRQVTRMPFAVTSYAITPDSRTIAFVTTEPAGTRTQPVIYTIQQDGRRLSRLASGQGVGDDEDETPRFGGGGGGISGLAFGRDGRTLFFREGRGVYSVGVGGSAAGGGAGGGAGRSRPVAPGDRGGK